MVTMVAPCDNGGARETSWRSIRSFLMVVCSSDKVIEQNRLFCVAEKWLPALQTGNIDMAGKDAIAHRHPLAKAADRHCQSLFGI